MLGRISGEATGAHSHTRGPGGQGNGPRRRHTWRGLPPLTHRGQTCHRPRPTMERAAPTSYLRANTATTGKTVSTTRPAFSHKVKGVGCQVRWAFQRQGGSLLRTRGVNRVTHDNTSTYCKTAHIKITFSLGSLADYNSPLCFPTLVTGEKCGPQRQAALGGAHRPPFPTPGMPAVRHQQYPWEMGKSPMLGGGCNTRIK